MHVRYSVWLYISDVCGVVKYLIFYRLSNGDECDTPPKRRTFRFYGFPSGKNFLIFLTYGPRNLVREKLGKNERKAALHRSVCYNISIVLSSSPSSCDSTGISTVQILALVVDLMHY